MPATIATQPNVTSLAGGDTKFKDSPWAYVRDEMLFYPKALYFGLNLVVYVMHALSANYFLDVWKLPIYKFGYISSLQGFNFFGSLVWSHVADKINRPRLIIGLCATVYCVMMCALQANPFDKEKQVIATSVYMALVNGTAQFFLAGCFPLLDALILALLSRDPRNSKEIFGRQRLWGTFGHCAATYIGITGKFLMGYAGLFVMLVACTSFFVSMVVLGIPSNLNVNIHAGGHHGHGGGSHQNERKDAAQIERERPTVGSPTIRLLSNPHFLFFMAFILIAGYVRAIMTNFQAYFISKVMLQKDTFVGHAGAIRVVTEVGVFFFGKQLMAFMGPYWMLIFSQVAGILRILGYGLIPVGVPGWELSVIPLELLKGLNTGLIVSSAVRLANDIAPRDCANTAQGLFSGIYTGLATAVGGMLGGWLIYANLDKPVPMQSMFLISALMTSVMTLLFALKYALVDRVIFTFGRKPNSPLH